MTKEEVLHLEYRKYYLYREVIDDVHMSRENGLVAHYFENLMKSLRSEYVKELNLKYKNMPCSFLFGKEVYDAYIQEVMESDNTLYYDIMLPKVSKIYRTFEPRIVFK